MKCGYTLKDNKYMAKCKYCQTEYYTNVLRMWKHLRKCANCPGTVKETVKQKQKAGAPRPNVPDNDDEDDVEMYFIILSRMQKMKLP